MTADQSPQHRPIGVDTALAIVACDRRRAILRSLEGTNGDLMSVETLVERVIERLRDDESGFEPSRRQLQLELHHSHLPKLDCLGVIDYDSETKQVRETIDDRTHQLLTAVESVDANT